MAPGSIDVVLQPLGKEVGVLEAPLAKYKPEIVVLITNMEKSIKLVEGHLKNQWRNTAGKHRPRVIPKLIGEPWTERTVEEYMEAFNQAVIEVEKSVEAKGKTINWHVGTAGGTNLMAIASAMSAFSHRFPAFYSNAGKQYPDLAETPEELVVEIQMLDSVGPAFVVLNKKPRSLRILRHISDSSDSPVPVTQKSIAKMLDSTVQSASAGMAPLKKHGLISQTDTVREWEITTFGKLMLTQFESD